MHDGFSILVSTRPGKGEKIIIFFTRGSDVLGNGFIPAIN